jgi:hypothetical protein
MRVPFSRDDFFGVFTAYNEAIWPVQFILIGVALLVVASAWRGRPTLALAGLAILWAWMGVVYHWTFFAPINPVANVFGAFFVAQAALLGWVALDPSISSVRVSNRDGRAKLGAAMIVASLIVYPAIGIVTGHRFPAVPTFGLPCPTVMFTFGVLTWVLRPIPWPLVVIPFAWSLVGTSGAIALTVPEDFLLLPVAITSLIVGRRRRQHLARHATTAVHS